MSVSTYKIVKRIGHGAHGDVFLVHGANKEKLYAMKKIPNHACKFDFESKLLPTLGHPNIIKTYEIIEQTHEVYLLFEYASAGDLQQYVRSNFQLEKKPIPEKNIISWLCQILLGLFYLHNELHIIHRDIKLSNVLLMDNGLLKLADFGIARKLEKHEDYSCTTVGTPYYLSPEAIDSGRWSKKSDVWGVGCILYELCTGKKPFQGNSIGSIMKSIVEDTFEDIPSHYSKWLATLISSMLEKKSDKRPSVQDILEKPEIRRQFLTLKSVYKEFASVSYPQLTLPTTKYDRDEKISNMKIFAQSLKTAKNRKMHEKEEEAALTPLIKRYRPQEKQTSKKLERMESFSLELENKPKVERTKFVDRSLKTIIENRKTKRKEP